MPKNPDTYQCCMARKSQLWMYFAILVEKLKFWGTWLYFPEYFPDHLRFPEG